MTYGVAAAKGNDDYFQKVPLEKLAAPEVTLTANGTALKNLEDIVSITPMPTSQFSADQVIDLGYGIEADNYSNYKNIDVSGKVVFIRSGEPKNRILQVFLLEQNCSDPNGNNSDLDHLFH